MRFQLGLRVSTLLFVGAFPCALEATALAQIPEPASRVESQSAPPSVTITVVGDPDDAAALEARVASWFHQQGTITDSHQKSAVDPRDFFAETHGRGVRVWIVLKLPSLVRVFFAVEEADAEQPRYLLRDVAINGELDELALEQVAQVVNLSATALWSGNLKSSRQEVEKGLGAVAPAPVEADRASPDRASTDRVSTDHVSTDDLRRPRARVSTSEPAPNGRAQVAIGFEYAARLAGPEGLLQGPGANLGLSWRRRSFELGARLHAQLLLPHEVVHSGVTLRLRGAALGLGVSMAHRMFEHVFVTGELGSGLDLVDYGIVALGDASLRPSSTKPELQPLSYASIGLRAHLGVVSVSGAALLVVQVLRTHYDISDADQRSELFRPWQLQPGLVVSVTW